VIPGQAGRQSSRPDTTTSDLDPQAPIATPQGSAWSRIKEFLATKMQTPHPKKTLKKKPQKSHRERGKCATSNASPESQEPNQSYTNHTTKKQTKNSSNVKGFAV
jgi:hypothetical protein